MKKTMILTLMLLLILTSCNKVPNKDKNENNSYKKYDITFFDMFDTVTTIAIYDDSEEEANEKLELLKARFYKLHRIFDRYHTYKDISNLKKLNDNAGKSGLVVEEELFDLVEKSVEWNKKAGGKINIAIGPVVDLWNDYSDLYNEGNNPEDVKKIKGEEIPSDNTLNKLKNLTDINKINLNKKNKSIYLEDPNMELELGALAKGYSVELLADYAEKELGIKSGIISAGGNVRIIGKPLDRDAFNVAILDPDNENDYLAVLSLNECSVVTSGDYQRYFTYKDQRYPHIIDSKTLKPSTNYRSVSVIIQDSGLADFLSTSIYLSDYEEGKKIAEEFGADCIWMMANGEIRATEGAKRLMGENNEK
ncbi:MAG: FAD:protein FMN transferase [Peptoniphilaceae bacterium]